MYYNFSDHTTNMNLEALAGLNEFDKKYSVVSSYHLNQGSDTEVIGRNVCVCRFCKKSRPEVTFKSVAHALPHFIGNNTLFTHLECDSCNNKFGRLLENEFGKYMHLNHTLSSVKGKKGYPQFKTTDADITSSTSHIDWSNIPDENIHYDKEGGILTIKQKIPSFTPVAVYKCLVKIALSIMPEEELVNVEKTIEWINEVDHRKTQFNFKYLKLIQGAVESSIKLGNISIVLAKRREETTKQHPCYMLSLTYSNYMFQLAIPLCSLDDFAVNTTMPYIPNLIDLQYGYGKMDLQSVDLSSKNKLRGAEMTIKIRDLDDSGIVEMVEVNEPKSYLV